jgi:hypothetical protein
VPSCHVHNRFGIGEHAAANQVLTPHGVISQRVARRQRSVSDCGNNLNRHVVKLADFGQVAQLLSHHLSGAYLAVQRGLVYQERHQRWFVLVQYAPLAGHACFQPHGDDLVSCPWLCGYQETRVRLYLY